MDPAELQLFALELIVASRLAMDPPDVRRQLADAIGAFPADCGPVERDIRRRALDIVLGSEGPTEV